MRFPIRTVVLCALALAGCDETPTAPRAPAPREVSADAIGHYCGMSLAEHAGPKGQIFVAGRKDPVWFSSVRDTLAFTLLPEEPKDITAIYVNDMGRAHNWDQPEPGTWISAREAWYVIGSDRKGGMGADELVPFGDATQAKAFAAAHGGRVVAFADIPRAAVIADGEAADPPAAPNKATAPASGAHGH